MKALIILSVYFTYIVVVIRAEKDAPIVETSQGSLSGTYMTTKKGREFSAFLGIPYAKPPVGELRFAAPLPTDSWKGIKYATKIHAVCPQRDIYRRSTVFEGEEDCLYLNVYTPRVATTDLLPVMVWLHGGGWLCGAGNSMWYGPGILLDKDVVLVVPNYRLGFLGFMATGDLVVPGNNGLKDQNMALRWVRQNIMKFGGNPNKVTIFGESAGGASSHFHMLSPMSKGLIHGAIAQSGTAFVNWGLSPKDQGIRNTKKMAELFDCPADSTVKMVQCLRNIKDPMKFVTADEAFMEWDFDPMIPFKPVIEPPHEDAFMTEHPADIMRSGRAPSIPWITGLNTEDGALRAAGIFGNPHLIDEMNDDFHRIVPISLEYDETANNVDYVTNQIKQFYFGNAKINESSVEAVVNMYTDAWFLSGADDAVRLHVAYAKSPVYYYLFGYRGVASFTSIFGDPVNDYGVCHADDLQYLFPIGDGLWPHKKPSDSCKQISEILTTLWVNFATTGNPTPETNNILNEKWLPVTSPEHEYLYIGGVDQINMKKGLYLDRVEFWRELPTHYRKNIIKDEL